MKSQSNYLLAKVCKSIFLVTLVAGALFAASSAEAGSRVSLSIGLQGGYGGLYVNGGHRYGGHGYYGGPRYYGGGYYGGGYYGYRPYYYPYYGAAVIAPVVVASLPFGYSTVWVEGNPYYYHNNVYYERVTDGYRVVPPPKDVVMVDGEQPADYEAPASASAPASTSTPSSNAPTPVPTYSKPKVAAVESTKLFAYPRNGQTQTQASFDRIECERWGSGQTGFNPTQANADAARSADYYRATGACLEGRGYTVK